MRNNIITANVGDETFIKTRSAVQYDYGLRLAITGIALPEKYEVHFANTGSPNTTVVSGEQDVAAIPDEYLESGEDIHAWLFMHTGENDGYTACHIMIPVKRRHAILNTIREARYGIGIFGKSKFGIVNRKAGGGA